MPCIQRTVEVGPPARARDDGAVEQRTQGGDPCTSHRGDERFEHPRLGVEEQLLLAAEVVPDRLRRHSGGGRDLGQRHRFEPVRLEQARRRVGDALPRRGLLALTQTFHRRKYTTVVRMNWMITGTSTGFGRALALAARDAGHDVIATARNLDDIADLDGVRREPLDLAQPNDIDVSNVDVLVNNAGFGLLGAFEELTDQELREAFEVNLFGGLALTRAVLPGMRARGYGRIVQMSSVIGVTSGLGGAAYAGPKAALEAISVALAAEIRSFGIRVTIVQPGPFRTAFGGASLRWATPLPAYADVIGPPRAAFEASHGSQPNDPRGARRRSSPRSSRTSRRCTYRSAPRPSTGSVRISRPGATHSNTRARSAATPRTNRSDA